MLRPRDVCVGLVTLIIALIAPVVAQGQTLPFPGGVEFQLKTDEMTDKKLCSVFTPMRGAQVGVYGPTSAAFWVHPKRGPVARSPVPMMRVGKESPIQLTVGDKPSMIEVPREAAQLLIQALYMQKGVALRWYNFPAKDQQNIEVVNGDLGAAYDHAIKVCDWKRMTVKRVPLSKEPGIYQGEKGYINAWFGGRAGWNVTYMPEFGSCEIQYAGETSITFFRSQHGNPDSVLQLGEMLFEDSEGREAARVRHTSFGPAPITEILAAADKAGQYGRVLAKGESGIGRASLFGLMDAVAYAERTCSVRLR